MRPGGISRITGEQEYGFKHVLIRDVSYGQLPKSRRARAAQALRRLARNATRAARTSSARSSRTTSSKRALTARTVARPLEPPPLDAAVEALSRAAAKTERREGFREAERFYTRALELADEPTWPSAPTFATGVRECWSAKET